MEMLYIAGMLFTLFIIIYIPTRWLYKGYMSGKFFGVGEAMDDFADVFEGGE